jgi:predicted membrane channel-forming protein YqfA (hemolysin III family)
MELKTPTISVAGGDIKNGLGWMTLIMAIAAAALPYVTSALDAQTLRTVRFLCLGVGGILLLYLLTQNLRFVAIGLVLALAGYILATIGVVRQQQTSQT